VFRLLARQTLAVVVVAEICILVTATVPLEVLAWSLFVT
jgi:hypothetical protein